MNIKALVRTVPDFPKPGIRFRDITPLLANGAGFRHVIGALADRYSGKVDKIVGIEARGFIFGAAIASAIGAASCRCASRASCRSAPIGPRLRARVRYEPRRDPRRRHRRSGERVAVIDDLLATGGTALAALALVENSGAKVVECGFVIELLDLPGRKRIEHAGHAVHALCGFTEDES